MKSLFKLVIFVAVLFGLIAIFLPNKITSMLPMASLKDSSSVFSASEFLNEIKIVYGTFNIKDESTYIYGNSIPFCKDASLKISTKARVQFYVDVDTSYIQVNNSSQTYTIDTSKAILKWNILEEEITKEVSNSNCFDTAEAWMDNCLLKRKQSINAKIAKCREIDQAQKTLNLIKNSQMLFLIQSGYAKSEL